MKKVNEIALNFENDNLIKKSLKCDTEKEHTK